MVQVSIQSLNAVTTGTGAVANCARESVDVGVYITPNGTVSSGTVIIETSDDQNYAGTWIPIGSPISPTTGAKLYMGFQGCYEYLRARIGTNIGGGGTVTVRIDAGNRGF